MKLKALFKLQWSILIAPVLIKFIWIKKTPPIQKQNKLIYFNHKSWIIFCDMAKTALQYDIASMHKLSGSKWIKAIHRTQEWLKLLQNANQKLPEELFVIITGSILCALCNTDPNFYRKFYTEDFIPKVDEMITLISQLTNGDIVI